MPAPRVASASGSVAFRMGRWLAYAGSPIRLEELLVKRDRSLIDQSLHARQRATPTNGDGFGVGWSGDGDDRLQGSIAVPIQLGTTATFARSPPASPPALLRTHPRVDRDASDPDDDRHHQRPHGLGVPLLERARLSLALLQHADGCLEGALPGYRGACRPVGRDPRGRLGASRRPPRSLERGGSLRAR